MMHVAGSVATGSDIALVRKDMMSALDRKIDVSVTALDARIEGVTVALIQLLP